LTGVDAYKELPTGQVVEALIERASRLREDMKKSTQKTILNDNRHMPCVTLNQNNNNADVLSRHKSIDMLLADGIDPSLNNENMCDILGIQSSLRLTGNVHDSNESILTDLDGLENEQSLLDDLLYGRHVELSHDQHQPKTSPHSIHTRAPRGKPPSGRSRSPSLTRVGRTSHRSRSRSSRSVAHSSDSDTASRVSFDMPGSDLDDSGNGKYIECTLFVVLHDTILECHDIDNLSKERLQLLTHVRTARVRIDHLQLSALMNNRESPSHASFGRTNKSKRAT
jgi:hypothetical protein